MAEVEEIQSAEVIRDRDGWRCEVKTEGGKRNTYFDEESAARKFKLDALGLARKRQRKVGNTKKREDATSDLPIGVYRVTQRKNGREYKGFGTTVLINRARITRVRLIGRRNKRETLSEVKRLRRQLLSRKKEEEI